MGEKKDAISNCPVRVQVEQERASQIKEKTESGSVK
jgi:hypothetical protein